MINAPSRPFRPAAHACPTRPRPAAPPRAAERGGTRLGLNCWLAWCCVKWRQSARRGGQHDSGMERRVGKRADARTTAGAAALNAVYFRPAGGLSHSFLAGILVSAPPQPCGSTPGAPPAGSQGGPAELRPHCRCRALPALTRHCKACRIAAGPSTHAPLAPGCLQTQTRLQTDRANAQTCASPSPWRCWPRCWPAQASGGGLVPPAAAWRPALAAAAPPVAPAPGAIPALPTRFALPLRPHSAPPAGAGSPPSWYSCSCSAGSAAPCVCPSTAAPGGLAPALHLNRPPPLPPPRRPQHDDSILQTTYDAITSILNGRQSANGCKVRSWHGGAALRRAAAEHASLPLARQQGALPLLKALLASAAQAVATMFTTSLKTSECGGSACSAAAGRRAWVRWAAQPRQPALAVCTRPNRRPLCSLLVRRLRPAARAVLCWLRDCRPHHHPPAREAVGRGEDGKREGERGETRERRSPPSPVPPSPRRPRSRSPSSPAAAPLPPCR